MQIARGGFAVSTMFYAWLPEKTVAADARFAILLDPVPRANARGRGEPALNILRCVGVGGHNNTEFNPVFRGMVRSP